MIIYTGAEAEKLWGLSAGTIRSACTRGRLRKYVGKGVRQAGGTWLVADWVMKKEYGKRHDDEPDLLDMYFINKFRMSTLELYELSDKIGVNTVYEAMKSIEENRPYHSTYVPNLSDVSIEVLDEMSPNKRLRFLAFISKLDYELFERDFEPDEIELKFKIWAGDYPLYIRVVSISDSVLGIFKEVAEQAGFEVGTQKMDYVD